MSEKKDDTNSETAEKPERTGKTVKEERTFSWLTCGDESTRELCRLLDKPLEQEVTPEDRARLLELCKRTNERVDTLYTVLIDTGRALEEDDA